MKTQIRKLLAGALMALIASGCATTSKYSEECKSWVGKDASELFLTWGAPDKSVDVDSETKLVEYLKTNGTIYNPNVLSLMTGGGSMVPNACKTQFRIKSGKVAGGRFWGTACVSK